MKVYQALLPLAAAMMIAGCGSRSTAQNVVGQAESALNEVRGDASVAAPNELKAADATLAHMKQNFDQHEYKVVIADVPEFNNQIGAVKTAIETKQSGDLAATQELQAVGNDDLHAACTGVLARWLRLADDAARASETIDYQIARAEPDRSGVGRAKCARRDGCAS